MNIPQPGFYYHYKHDAKDQVNNCAYEVIGVGFHTELKESPDGHFVTYRPLYPEAHVYQVHKKLGVPCFDIRPLDKWLEPAPSDGITIPRFRMITDKTIIKELTRIRNNMYS